MHHAAHHGEEQIEPVPRRQDEQLARVVNTARQFRSRLTAARERELADADRTEREENTRASLFEGMRRKETFAVSGPHIKVRLFGGWEFTDATLAGADWVKNGYAKGVPMGGDLEYADVMTLGQALEGRREI